MREIRLLILSLAIAVSIYLGYKEIKRLHKRIDTIDSKVRESSQRIQNMKSSPFHNPNNNFKEIENFENEYSNYQSNQGRKIPSTPHPSHSHQQEIIREREYQRGQGNQGNQDNQRDVSQSLITGI